MRERKAGTSLGAQRSVVGGMQSWHWKEAIGESRNDGPAEGQRLALEDAASVVVAVAIGMAVMRGSASKP